VESWPCLRFSSAITHRWRSAGAGRWEVGAFRGRRGYVGRTVLEPDVKNMYLSYPKVNSTNRCTQYTRGTRPGRTDGLKRTLMEDDDRRAPLLGAGAGGQSTSLRRSDSARSLRSAFLSRLPNKLRAGLDPERPTDFDLARAKGLSPGNHHQPCYGATAPVASHGFHCGWLRRFLTCVTA
jgi:hypothetical protein